MYFSEVTSDENHLETTINLPSDSEEHIQGNDHTFRDEEDDVHVLSGTSQVARAR